MRSLGLRTVVLTSLRECESDFRARQRVTTPATKRVRHPSRFAKGGLRFVLAPAAIDIRARKADALPEEPALGRSRHLAQLDVAFGWRLVHSPLPAGHRHRRYVQLTGKIRLVQSQAVAQLFNSCCPHWLGKSCSGSHRIFASPGSSAGVFTRGAAHSSRVSPLVTFEYTRQSEPMRYELQCSRINRTS